MLLPPNLMMLIAVMVVAVKASLITVETTEETGIKPTENPAPSPNVVVKVSDHCPRHHRRRHQPHRHIHRLGGGGRRQRHRATEGRGKPPSPDFLPPFPIPPQHPPTLPTPNEVLLMALELSTIAEDSIKAKGRVEDRVRVLMRSLCQCLFAEDSSRCAILTKEPLDKDAVRVLQNEMSQALKRPRSEIKEWGFLFLALVQIVIINVGIARLAYVLQKRSRMRVMFESPTESPPESSA